MALKPAPLDSDWRIEELLRWVNDGNYRATLTELSVRFALSPHHLGRLFREQIGLSFHGYLRAARCKRAAELLLDRWRPVKEVAVSVGYSDLSNFNHELRRVFS